MENDEDIVNTANAAWLAEYGEWLADRAKISAAEEAGDADPDDWAESDDSGIELLHAARHLLGPGEEA